MLRLDQYDVAVRDLLRNKQAARSDDARQAWDQVWSDMLTARNHASLVARFQNESAAMRNQAAQLSGQPGGQRQAEAYRVRASELHEIAERHKKAAEERQGQAEAALADCVAMSKRDGEQQNGQQSGLGDTGDVPQQRRRADRRQANEQPQTADAQQQQRRQEEQRPEGQPS